MEDINTVVKNLNENNQKAIEALKRDLSRVRAGKASASLLDGVRVSYYGTQSPLNQISSISTPDPRTIVIAPWDVSVIGEIEKAIIQSDLGLNPQNNGKVVRINVPALTEERRKELVKSVNKMGEEAKVSVRQHRKVANDSIKSLEKAKELSEDDSKKHMEQVQKSVDQTTEQIDQIVEKKSKEITTI